MKKNKIELLLRGANIGNAAITLNYPGVKVLNKGTFDNKNYAFLEVEIESGTAPGTAQIQVQLPGRASNKNRYSIPFPIKARAGGNGSSWAKGVTSEDLLYLIMPDRFNNGDYSNDKVPGMRDQTLRRDTVFNRHGGDLPGIQQKLDYLSDLGVTALWLNPVLELSLIHI